MVRSPSYTQTTSAFLLTGNPQLQPSGSWLSQKQARVLGKALKLLTSPHLFLIAENSVPAFVRGHCTMCLDFREDLAAVTSELLGEVAPSTWIPVRHFWDPGYTGPLGERESVIAGLTDERNGAVPGHPKVPCFPSPKSFLGHSQNLFLFPTSKGNDRLCIFVLFRNDLKNIIQRLISLKCDRH